MALDTAVNPVEDVDNDEEEGVTEVDDLDEPAEEETTSPVVEPENEATEENAGEE